MEPKPKQIGKYKFPGKLMAGVGVEQGECGSS